MVEQVRFCIAPDGTRIAYAAWGDGPGRPLVRAATWLTHVGEDAAFFDHWRQDLASDRPLLRYDLRGCGLSDRDVADLSLEAKVSDLAAVVDAAQLDRFDLLGVSGGGAIAIAYAARYPERVANLVLYGCYAQGRVDWDGGAPHVKEEEALLLSLTRVGWGQANPAFRRVFTTLFMPDAAPDQAAAFEELQLLSCTGEMAERIRRSSYRTDVVDLARQIRVPTLVLQVRGDAVAPLEQGRLLAALIPGSRFVALPGRNHILGRDDPAWRPFVDQVRRFTAVAPDAPSVSSPFTGRELEVLGLVADGVDNEAIAERLSLSVRTVERHLSNVYAKLGVSGRAARAAAAAAFARRR
jgi:pimeloyl-ACP methyl ester carboxylesterase/DNA-binding CsgD family transcriptional regulator